MSFGIARRGRTRDVRTPQRSPRPTRESVIRRQRAGGSSARTSTRSESASALARSAGSSAGRRPGLKLDRRRHRLPSSARRDRLRARLVGIGGEAPTERLEPESRDVLGRCRSSAPLSSGMIALPQTRSRSGSDPSAGHEVGRTDREVSRRRSRRSERRAEPLAQDRGRWRLEPLVAALRRPAARSAGSSTK